MHSLGSACAIMHKYFAQLNAENLSIDTDNLLIKLINYHEDCVSKMPTEECELYKQTVVKQEKIINSLHDDFLCSLPKGITHKDFAADNILFYKDSVSAILDFDTNRYGYQWQDIGRILLSLSLKNEDFNVNLVNAFISGYQEHLEMNISHIANAMRLSWCIETPWWIYYGNFINPTIKAARFRDEIIWLTDNWFELEYILNKKAK
jgi:homoserine kinase type II